MAATSKEPQTRTETALATKSISEQATVAPRDVIAIDAFNAGKLVIGGMVFEIGKPITRPTLIQRDNAMHVFRIDGPFRQGEDLNEKAKRSAKRKGTEAKQVTQMAAARVCDVYNWLTSRDEMIIANTVLEESILEAFPDSTDGKPDYIGKSFAMSTFKAPDKRYREYAIRVINVSRAEDGSLSAAQDETKTIDA